MPRPAIVIGIGGTGSWILSWLKKDLLETYGSLEHQPLRLLLIDTADLIAEVGGAGGNAQGQNAASNTNAPTNGAGYSRYLVLDQEREFVHVPTDDQDSLTRQIKSACLANDPGVSHISKWWQSDFYPDAMLKLKDGAGQFRQLGRLALMQGLHLHGANDGVFATISNMIDSVTRVAARNGQAGSLDVHIAGSMVGGTGSGIFVDIAWLVRKVLEIRGDQIQPFITGFFALPRAFSPQPRLDTRMKAFAAWRELNRMMTVRERESEFLVRWGQQDTTTLTVRKGVYDHIYLVDQGVGPAGTRPEESVFPVMAEAISFYLDSNAGVNYIQHIRTNLVNPKQTVPLRGNPTYSVLNVRSWKLPTYHNVRVARHEFAREFLRRLLQVVEQPTQNYSDPAHTRMAFTIKSDPLYRQRSAEIFTGAMQDTGSTHFLEDVAYIAQIPSDQFELSIRERAYYAFNVLNLYVQMPQPEGTAVQNMLNEVSNFAVPAMIDSNSNSELESHLEDVYKMLYGVNRRGGEYLRLYGDFSGDQFKGKLFDDLVHAHDFHIEVFQRRIRAWMESALNEPSNEKFSGLACVRDAINQTVEDLKLAIRFYIGVKDALYSVNEMQNNADSQYTIVNESVGKRGPFASIENATGFGAKRELRLYLEHENINLATKRDHRTVEHIINTLRDLQDYVESYVIPRLEMIVQQLVTDNDFTRISGLYRGLIDSLDDEQERHAFDERLHEITELLDTDTHVQIDTSRIDELLKRTRWIVDEQMNLRVEIRVSVDPQVAPIVLESNMRDPGKTIELVNRMVEGVAGYVMFEDDNQTALNVMGVKNLTNALPSLVNRYLHHDNTNKPAVKDIRTFYVRASGTQEEMQAIRTALNSLNIPRGSNNAVEVVTSDNRNKVTVFSARELIMPESFAEWEAAQRDYAVMVTGDRNRSITQDFDRVRNDHVFAGEREALRLEFQYYQEDKVNAHLPILDQRLVHLLEEHRHFDLFLQMWSLGWIVAERDNPADSETFWRLSFPEEYSFPTITLSQRGDADMLGVIARFAIYGRTLQGRDIQYVQIERTLDNTLRQIRGSREFMEELLSIYKFETETAAMTHHALNEQLQYSNSQIDPVAMKNKLDKLTQKLERPAPYIEQNNRRSLAEELAYDFTRYDQNANPLITNIDAHMQALSILLRLKYSNMARLLQQFMSQH